MAAALIITVSAAIAVLALNGWPIELAPWLRALIAWASILLGVAAIALRKAPSRSPQLSHARKPGWFQRMASATWIAMGLGLFYLLLLVLPPVARQVSELVADALEYEIVEPREEYEELVSETTDGDGQSGSMEISTRYNPKGAVIPNSASLSESEKPEMSVITASGDVSDRLRSGGVLYLHAFSHSTFDGQRWLGDGIAGSMTLRPGADGWIELQSADQKADYRYTVLHHLYLPGDNTVNLLHGARRVKLPELTQLQSGTRLLPQLRSMPGQIYQYEAESTPRRYEDLLVEGVAVEAGAIDPVYLAASKDAGLNLAVEQLAQRFENEPSLNERMAAIQRWFASAYIYNTTVDYPDDGRSAVEIFVADPEYRQGFCVHFATATALLMREMGVPSRVSYGWAGGEYHRGYEQFVFHGKHAHAWTEVWLKDQGWVVFDTTPTNARPETEIAPPGAVPPQHEPLAQVEDGTGSTGHDFYLTRELLMVLLGLAVLFFMVLLISSFGRFSLGVMGSGSGEDAPEAPPGYLQLLHQVCAKLGHPKPDGRTWMEHLKQLGDQEVAIPHADELVAYHYQVAYRGSARDRRMEKRLLRKMKSM